jgi:hypothetical protein
VLAYTFREKVGYPRQVVALSIILFSAYGMIRLFVQGLKMSYLIDTTKHIKIWFSPDKKVFLGTENQLRLIRMRETNPHITLHLLNSSRCLSPNAQKELASFCKKHRIISVDLDTQVQDLLESQEDKKLFQLAQDEIANSLTDNGGNLGAASDCARFIGPILRLGIYSDFDVNVKVDPNQAKMDSKKPLLLPIAVISDEISFNTDTIVVALDPITGTAPHPDALLFIKTIQNIIINNYTNLIEMSKSLLFQHDSSSSFDKYFREQIYRNIFSLRKKIQKSTYSELMVDYVNLLNQLPILNSLHSSEISNFLNEKHKFHAYQIKHYLYLRTVMNISGPLVIWRAFTKLFPVNLASECILYSLKHNQISQFFTSQINNLQNDAFARDDIDNVGIACDQAWTVVGREKARLREIKMNIAARSIQYSFRNYTKRKNTVQDNLVSLQDDLNRIKVEMN